jgi:predicted RNA-binding protein with RPS1 domain
VNVLPGKDGLVHVSQMDSVFVSDPSTVVTEGQKVKVWVTEIDSQGRINLSMLFDADGKPVIKMSPPRDLLAGPRRDSYGGSRRDRRDRGPCHA